MIDKRQICFGDVASSLRKLVLRTWLLCLVVGWAPMAWSVTKVDVTPKNADKYGIKVLYENAKSDSNRKVTVTFPATRPDGLKGFATLEVAYAGQDPKKGYQMVRAPQYAGMAMALGPLEGLKKTFVIIVYESSGVAQQVLSVPLEPWLAPEKANSSH